MLSPFNDEYFMKQAILEAQKALEKDEVPIGAVIVANNQIISRGHNLTECLNDTTAHAEMQAITAASGNIGAKYLNECTLYVYHGALRNVCRSVVLVANRPYCFWSKR